MQVEISASQAVGRAVAPPSKSYAHRMLICAGLSEGESIIKNIELSQDILATLDCLKVLGADYECVGDTVTITGIKPQNFCSYALLPCRECGTTMRFFIMLCLAGEKTFSLTGSPRLLQRPMDVYEKICKERGLLFSNNGSVITVKGPLTPGQYEVAGDVSSQFISGLMFSLPFMKGDSRIVITGKTESSSYIDMTLEALRQFGITIERNDNLIFIKGKQEYVSGEKVVEGDFSNAAFLEALNLFGHKVKVSGLNYDSIQGDKVYRDYYLQLKESMPTLSLADCPDLGPVLFVCAAGLNGAVFTDTKRLRIKESDRVAAMAEELKKFGVDLIIEENRVVVPKTSLHAPNEILSGHNDHRIVMALSILCTVYGGIIDGANAINKSWPDYFKVLKKLGIEVREKDADNK